MRQLADRNLSLVGLEDSQKLILCAERVGALTSNEWNRELGGVSDDDGQVINPISKPQADRPKNDECPYKGLFAFQREDAKFFFGRERFTATLIESVTSQPFLAIIGNSGMGKSSVVFAGLVPELEKLENWQFLTFRPKNNPFMQLAEGLVGFLHPALTDKDEPQFIQEQAKYAESLKNKELELTDILDGALANNHHPHRRLLIVVDQFEELYTLCSLDYRNLFIDILLRLIDSEKDKENPDVVIVVTLRVDFYGFALDYQPLAELLQKWKPETLIGMSREELKLAIEKPAEVVGLEIQDGLTKIILDGVIDNPGELPLLEFALGELWKQRKDRQLTIEAYHQIGGIEKALVNYAESVYKKFEGKQPQIKHIFTQLVRFGEQTENTRRLATYEQIGQANWKLVTQLADNRLVVTGQNTRQRTAEVVHEALIRGWERLQQWMVEDRDFRQWQDRLRFGIKTWEETGRSYSALLRGALLVEAEDWLKEKHEGITDAQEIEFIKASRQFQEQEDIERIQDLLNLSQKELQLKQQLSSLVVAVKAGIKFRNIQKPSEELKRNLVERLQQGSYEIVEQNQLVGHNGEVNGVAFSPDCSIIASVSDDQTVKLWKSDGQLLDTFKGHNNDVLRVTFSPDGQIIASASADRTVRLWSLEGTLLKTLKGHSDRVYGVSFSPDSQIIASASVDRTVRFWSLEGTLLKTLEGHTDRVWGVNFSPDGQIIASASADQTVRLWSLEGTLLRTLEGHLDQVWGVSFSPDGQIIASASADRTVRLWGLEGTLLKTLEGHLDQVWGVSFSPDGQIIASASLDKTVRLWSLEGTLLKTLEGHTDRVWGVNFSPDGQIIASASGDRTVRLWGLEGTLLKTLEGHLDQVWGVSFSPDGQIIASTSFDRTVRLWEIEGKSLQTLEGHTDRIWGVSFSPDSQIIASASVDKTVRLWSPEGMLLRTLEGHTDRVYGVSFSPDGQIIASASVDKTVRLWTLKGTLLRTLEGHMDQVWGVSFSPDGQIIASASVDKTVRLWTLKGTLLRTLEGHTAGVYGVSFSPDGQIIASASGDWTVKLWSLEGILLRTLEGHTEGVFGVSFSPDGQIIASASLDKTVKLWSLKGTLLRTLEGHTVGVYGVSFSPDGQIIASASADKTVRLWDIDPDDLILDLDIKLNNLLKKGCFWIRDYLKTNPNVSESDRNLCDGYC
ncbi:AAA family ATPase [Microcoleus sp. CAWBG58]|uniref:nSTAND1 domain-containing NTPase n=1 Tax=Microcoleus sp. CAWBG58 TaxID=2841651 RepID=UPI0025EB3587|nr:AAA family ATPase [Microcoleus sp. CAWBG58]